MLRVYVSPFSYLSALPIMLAVMAITAVTGAMGENGIFIGAPVLFFFYIVVIMRIAIPASSGKLTPTNDIGELLSYSCRYAAVTLAWTVPLAAAVFILLKYGDALPMSALRGSWDKVGFGAFLLFLLFLVALFLPTLTLLIVLRQESLGEVFSAAAWRWLLVDRQEDLLPFYCFLSGGALTMACCSLLPAAVILFVTLQISLEAVIPVSGILYFWAGSTMPILTGLMAGAFVAGESSQNAGVAAPVFSPDGPATLVKIPTAARVAGVAPLVAEGTSMAGAEARPDVKQIEQRITAMPEQEVPAALASLAETEQQAPLLASVEKALLFLRANNRNGAVEAASSAANLAVERGFADVAVHLFLKLGEDRMRLSLEPTTLERMGKLLEQRLIYMDAAWCYHAAALKVNDVMKAQKRLLQTAEAALNEGRHKEARALLELLLRKYPDTKLREFAWQRLNRVKKLGG